ncbi:MAG: HicB family protein [Burkholderiales bacterium]|jgi:predicted RNase H-like HicB family nuclease|nr:MAG: HicB family protein [Burkholderiales bacterium]
MKLSAVFEKVDEGYIGFIEELPGANAQEPTLEKTRAALVEAVELVLEGNRLLVEEAIEGRNVIREPLVLERE